MMINRFGGNLGTGSCEEVDKDRGRDTYCYAPPAQNRTCGFPASGSHLGCLTTRSFATEFRDRRSNHHRRCHAAFACPLSALHRQSLLCIMVKKSACHGYQRNPLPLLMPVKNRPTLDVGFRRRSRLATRLCLALHRCALPVHCRQPPGKHQRLPA
jgi:hypothetical protein